MADESQPPWILGAQVLEKTLLAGCVFQSAQMPRWLTQAFTLAGELGVEGKILFLFPEPSSLVYFSRITEKSLAGGISLCCLNIRSFLTLVVLAPFLWTQAPASEQAEVSPVRERAEVPRGGALKGKVGNLTLHGGLLPRHGANAKK